MPSSRTASSRAQSSRCVARLPPRLTERQNETFSAHVLIYDKLRGPDALGQLSKLVSDVVEAKEAAGAEIECVCTAVTVLTA